MRFNDFIQISGPLFEAVQKKRLFPDPKIFVDSYPNSPPKNILKTFEKERHQRDFDLKSFVLKHFIFPQEDNIQVSSPQSMTDYIDSMWDLLEKEMHSPSKYSTLISLPKPHIVPGGRFRECFYWDSYFTALGLVVSKRMRSIKNMIENFASLIDRFGFIPNGNRIYFASRSQPPYFSHMLELMLKHEKEEWVLGFMPQLEAEYAFWMSGKKELKGKTGASAHVVILDEKTVLNRYYDKLNIPRPEAFQRETALASSKCTPDFFRHLRAICASGWDFSSRFLENPQSFQTIWALNILPVDLNCLMYHLESTLANFSKRLNLHDKCLKYQALAKSRRKAIIRLFWNEKKKFFFDYHFLRKKQTPVWSLAGVFPLFHQIATKKQAEGVICHLKEQFLLSGGFVTSLYEGTHQWDMPNGWAPLQWTTIRALLNYGKEKLAKEGARRWIGLNQKIYGETGKLLEKYNVRDCSSSVARGEYALQEGFGWTNGVALSLLELFQL